MAYMSQEKKASLAPAIKAILAEYGLKGSIGVRHHSTLVLNIASGPVDFIGERAADRYDNPLFPAKYLQVNVYHVGSHFVGKSKIVLEKLVAAMKVGNRDNSDLQSDYHDVGWYVDINVGQWDKPYVLTVREKIAA